MHISGSHAYSIENDVEKIKHEIMANGPVEGAFTVFEDFLQYKSGTVIYIMICSHTYNVVCLHLLFSHIFSQPTLPTSGCSCIPVKPTEIIKVQWRSGAVAYSCHIVGTALHRKIK